MAEKYVECPICGNRRFSTAKRPKCKRTVHRGTLDPEPRMTELPRSEWPASGTPSSIPTHKRTRVNPWKKYIDKERD